MIQNVKCISYLAHVISGKGVLVDLEKIIEMIN